MFESFGYYELPIGISFVLNMSNKQTGGTRVDYFTAFINNLKKNNNMCMYSTRQRPLVAKNDIICVKYLRKTPGGNLVTPYRNVEPPINKPFKPASKEVEFYERFMTNELNGGVIHAQTQNVMGKWGTDCIAFKAIIPKGTEYWVNVRGYAIAAKKMVITDEKINIDNPDETLLKDILLQTISSGDISVGDFYIKDKGFLSPLDMTEEYAKEAVGIVVGFKGKEPLIWDGNVSEYLAVDTHYDSKFDEFIPSDKIKEDMDGEKHMAAFLKKYGENFDKDRFQVYGKYVSYKPEIGKWYQPAFGEMNTLIENLMFVHAAAWLTGLDIFLPVAWYWTSSEYYAGGCWGVYFDDNGAYYDWRYRDSRCRACFFLASTNNIPKVKINISCKSLN